MKASIKRIIYLISILTTTTVMLVWGETAIAQYEIGPGWSEPLNLSNSLSSSNAPAIVGDPYGSVHVFWSENMGGGENPEVEALQSGNSIYYRRLKDEVWSEPTDIFHGGENSRLEEPYAVVDESGLLHLTWIQNGTLQYSYVAAWDTERVRNWAPPVVINRGWVGEVRLLNTGGQILAVYTVITGEATGLYAVVIDPEEQPLPVLIWTGAKNLIPLDIGAVVDAKGRVHVVWSVSQPLSPVGLAVYYSSSETNGSTWSGIRTVASTSSEEDSLQHANPWIAAHGEEEIHIQWAQGVQTYRWHQVSNDGGKSWGRAYQIWPDLISQTGSQAVGLDGEGTLYWVDVLRYPNGAYLIRWSGQEWQRPELFFSIVSSTNTLLDYRINAHAIRLAIVQGNQLHIVFKDQDRGEIWYMQKTLPSRRLPEILIPTTTPQPLPSATPLPTLASPTEVAAQQNLLQVELEGDVSILAESPGATMLAGALPVVLLISYLAFLKMKRKS